MIKTLYPIFQRWSEKGSVYIISDTHFDDEDRDVMGYRITEAEQMGLIKQIAHKNDTLIHLGDVGNPEYFKDIKAYKILILGNHDQSAERFKSYFDEIYTGPLIISDKIIISHEPIYGLDFMYNIHGHDHNVHNIGDDNHMNLAANVCWYMPKNLKDIIQSGVLKKISDIHRVTIDNATLKKELKNS